MKTDSTLKTTASGTIIQGRCAYCGELLDLLRAPAFVMRGSEQKFYCQKAHAALDDTEPFETKGQDSRVSAIGHVEQSTPSSSESLSPLVSVPKPSGDESLESRSEMAISGASKSEPQSEKKAEKPYFRSLAKITFQPQALLALLCLVLITLLRAISGDLRAAEFYASLSLSALLLVELWLQLKHYKRLIAQADELFHRGVNQALGSSFVLHEGDVVQKDSLVLEGEATGAWLAQKHASMLRTFTENDHILAGFHLTSGSLRLKNIETPLSKPVQSLARPETSCCTSLDRVQAAGRFRLYGSILAPIVTFLISSTLLELHRLELIWRVTLVFALFSGAYRKSFFALFTHEALLRAYRLGFVFPNAASLTKTAQIKTAIFSVRGALLQNQPELVEGVSLAELKIDELIAIAQAAFAEVEHPLVQAVEKAANQQKLKRPIINNCQFEPAFGSTGQLQGQPLLVGNRGLLQKHRVSIAQAESKLSTLEQLGRTVVLIAINDRLVGLLAFKNRIKTGSRKALIQLRAAHIDTILLSGDSQLTTDALAAQLDIQRFRAEVPQRERGKAVEALREEGHLRAMIGRSPLDDAAMTQADVGILMNAPAAQPRANAALLVNTSPSTAAHALLLTQQLRERVFHLDFGVRFCEILAVLIIFTEFFPIYCAPLLLGIAIFLGAFSGFATKPLVKN